MNPNRLCVLNSVLHKCTLSYVCPYNTQPKVKAIICTHCEVSDKPRTSELAPGTGVVGITQYVQSWVKVL